MTRTDEINPYFPAKKIRNICEKLLREDTLPGCQKKEILNYLNIKIPSYKDFIESVPLVTKKDIFGNTEFIEKLLRKNRMKGVQIVPAAGTTRQLMSFRIENPLRSDETFSRLANTVEKIWNLDKPNYIVVNSYPSGVNIPSIVNSVDCGPKLDVFKHVLKNFHTVFDSFVIVSQPHFLAQLIDSDFISQYPDNEFYFILGGSWFPDTFLNYLQNKTGKKNIGFDQVMSFYGMAEIGLGLGVQLPHLNRIRASLQENESKFLVPSYGNIKPMICLADSQNFFFEDQEGEIIVTDLRANADFPLLRYRTGDMGRVIFPFDNFKPLNGSKEIHFSLAGREVPSTQIVIKSPEEIEQWFYANHELHAILTGDFYIRKEKIIFVTKNGDGGEIKKVSDLMSASGFLTKEQFEFITLDKTKILARDFLRKPFRYEFE